MKYKIVLVPFPFDDLSANKVRPALCVTEEIEPYGHIIISFITSRISKLRATHLVLDINEPEFAVTGLQVSSTVWVHRLATVTSSIIIRQLGELAPVHAREVDIRLRNLFGF